MAYKIQLPVVIPFATSYPAETYLFSILLNYEQTKGWIFNNYINLYGYITKENWIYQAYTFDDFRYVCPFISTTSFTSIDIIKNNYNSIVQFLKLFIASGYYIILQYEQYNLSLTHNYKTEYRIHEMLIYGFDEELDIFYVGEFLKSGRFTLEVVAAAEIEESVRSVAADMFRIDVIKYKFSEYQFDYVLLQKELNNYINSDRTILEYEKTVYTPAEIKRLSQGGYTYGLENYDLIKKAVFTYKNFIHSHPKGEINGIASRILRSTHVIYAHKELMLL